MQGAQELASPQTPNSMHVAKENREQREGGGILNMLRRGVEQPKSSAKEAAKSSTGWWQLLSH
eukprot:1832538-Amphidinium_carterae.1